MKKQDALVSADGTNAKLHYAIGDSLKDDREDLIKSFMEMGLSEEEALTLAGEDEGTYTVLKAVKANLTSFDPKQRVLLPFSSFVDSAGKAFFNTVSSLHSSRVSAYGFTAEAYALGLEQYQITEQLDGRICPVCRTMHGRIYNVEDARNLLDTVLRVSSKEDFKALQPWPRQSKKALEEMAALSPAEIVSKGWHIPPFHPRCRGLLSRVGKVPSLAQLESGNYKETPNLATVEDFEALGYDIPEEKVKFWNNTVKMPPAEVIAQVLGQTVDEYLAAVVSTGETSLASLSISNGKIKMKVSGPMQAKKDPGTVTLKVDQDALSIVNLSVQDGAKTSEFLKKFMQSMYTLTGDMGLDKLAVEKTSGYGSYAFAKSGFKPTYDEWATLKKGAYKALQNAALYPSLDEVLQKVLAAIKTSPDPANIFALADLSVGEVALINQACGAYLDLTDPESVARFLTYFGD